MKVFVVYWHPEPKSLNGAMFQTVCETLAAEGHEIRTSDLNDMGFNPVSGRNNFVSVKDSRYFKQQIEELRATDHHGFAEEVEMEIRKMEWCDLMIWQFPLWWFGLPAVLKGWVDRIFAMGRTYGGGHFYETGVFRGKRAFLALTTGGGEEAYRRGGFNGDIEAILRPIHRGMLQFVGFDVLAPEIVYGPVHLTEEQRRQHLATYATRLRRIADEEPVQVGSY